LFFLKVIGLNSKR